MPEDWVHGDTNATLRDAPPPRFVLQHWVGRLTHRQQGVLLLALRGPDGIVKQSHSKLILRNLRGCVMNSGREHKPMALGTFYATDSFMRTVEIADDRLWEQAINNFLSEIDSFNLHFFQHLIHAAAVLGIGHWDMDIRARWWSLYTEGVRKLHLHPETKEELRHRLRDGERPEEDE
jgi:hypothetical protein